MTYPSETPAQRGPHRLAWIAIGLVAVALAGVGWLIYQRQTEPAVAAPGNQQAVEAFQSAAAAQTALPKCAEVFVPGKKIDDSKAAAGCKDPSGGVQYLGSFTCPDGRKLYSVDANTGAPAGWGYGGEKYHAVKGEVAADAGYSKAYSACNG